MDPTLEEKQNDQAQGEQSGQGIIGRGINSINNLGRTNRLLSNSINKIGSRVAAQTALRGLTAFLGSTSGVWVPIAATVILVLVFTLIIVGFGGTPPSETNLQTPQASPTQIPTLSPAAP